MLIEARPRTLGGLPIRRVLPSRRRQRVGPFIFFDHLGPETLGAGRGVDVPPHPHIGLATVTYLFEGELVHRDSLGCVRTIRPGEINWMHAGRGIVHSERTGESHRRRESEIHGIQLWVALPVERENSEPEFHHYDAASIPEWRGDRARARILVGDAFGRVSPVRTPSPTLYLDVAMERGGRLPLPDADERALYVVSGEVSVGEERFRPGGLLVLADGVDTVVEAHEGTRALLLGGEALEGERHIWWNFVSSSASRIEQARRDWERRRFPPVPGEAGERAPMPDDSSGFGFGIHRVSG